jgi:hypothetical protein
MDETISQHVRFSTLTHNNMLRRGYKAEINVPIFMDSETKVRFDNLYVETEDYPTIPYKMQEKIVSDVKDENLKKKLTSEIFEQNRTFVENDISEENYKNLFHDQTKIKKKDFSNTSKKKFVYNKNYLKLDAFGFGMSNCALHLTFSSRNITECRHAYDTLSVFSSIMGALTASSGVIDGTLTEWDSRMRLIEQCTDSRMQQEYVNQIFIINF